MVTVAVPSLAKLNLDLRVLYKRPDGFHELRTVFQTISLRDTIEIGFEPRRRLDIRLNSSIDIPDNLVLRAAHLVCERLKLRGRFQLALKKKIPMGAGLGGGSSNAAAVLIALPALAGKQVRAVDLAEMGAELGSDVPFFLLGGTALGLGRGTELYPLPDQPSRPVLVVSTGIHVSTADAYRMLARQPLETANPSVANALTRPAELPMLREFQANIWTLDAPDPGGRTFANDFEEPVFQTHRALAAVVRKLRRLGAQPALMTGSGSALFGVFRSASDLRSAADQLSALSLFPAKFVTRSQYRALWRRALGPAAEASCFSS